MNKKTLLVILFACFSLVVIAVPISMIFQQEKVLKVGQEFRFKTAPIDPFDAFRGRYVALRLEQSQITKPKNLNLANGQKIYALITVDPEGFAKFSGISLTEPKGAAYLKAHVQYAWKDKLNLDLPIDRYYMEENKAPAAETLYRKHSVLKKQDAYVVVAIDKGVAVVKKLYVAGKPIEEAIRKEQP